MDPIMAMGLANSALNMGESAAGALHGSHPDNGTTRLASIWIMGPLLIWFAGREHMPEWGRSALIGAGILAIFWNAQVWNRDEVWEEGRRAGHAQAQGRMIGPVVDTQSQGRPPEQQAQSIPHPVGESRAADGTIPFRSPWS